MSTKHVQVLIDGEVIYDQQVDSSEIAFTNQDKHLALHAGPGTALRYLGALWGLGRTP